MLIKARRTSLERMEKETGLWAAREGGRWGCVKGPGMSRREGEVKRERERELVGMQK